MNDVSEAFEEWLENLTGERYTGSYVDGRWADNVPQSLNFLGVPQVATEKDLRVLPEGDRYEEIIKIHTVFELKIKDIVFFEGKSWRVFKVGNYKIGNYFKAFAILVQ